MKKLMTEWRQYLSEGEVKYSGILKVKPDPAILAEIKRRQRNLKDPAKSSFAKPLFVSSLPLVNGNAFSYFDFFFI